MKRGNVARTTGLPAKGKPGAADPKHSKKRRTTRRNSLKLRIGLLAASMVAMVVGAMTIVTFWTVNATLRSEYDDTLAQRASSVLAQLETSSVTPENAQAEVDTFRSYNPQYEVAITSSDWDFVVGDAIVLSEEATQPGLYFANSGGKRIATATDGAITVAVSQEKPAIVTLTSFLGVVLLSIGLIGVVVSIVAGMLVAQAGLRPLVRLRNAVQHVTKTDELRPIPVRGDDELAQLTRSFNEMLEALEQSRARQTQLVADAGHELKTPLTSMRTNIELLMMMYRQPGNISTEDREALEKDVIAQLDELSTLIGDLVDLARDHSPQVEVEVDLQELIITSLERVQRRRTDVTFEVETLPWELMGDYTSLNRAVVNVLDNAAKWSPANGVVRLKMRQLNDHAVSISVSDSGPGIPVADRERIFERFYRSVEARSMPGSGLGLAIVRQTMTRHGGTIIATESDDGGSMFVMTLPGNPA